MAVTHPVTKNTPIATLVAGRNRDPFAVLGPHIDKDGHGIVVRAFQPAARQIAVRLRATGKLVPMAKQDPAGVFEVRLPLQAAAGVSEGTAPNLPDYRLRITYPGDHVVE